MKAFFNLISELGHYKRHVAIGIFFHLLTAIFTIISIPFVIPFFQLLFGASPSDYKSPKDIWDIEATLNYGFSRLIAISDRYHALLVVCIVIVVIFLLRNISRFLASYFIIPARNGLLKDLRSSLFDSFMNMPLSLRAELKKGQIMSMMSNDILEIDHGILKALEMIFKMPLIVLGSSLFMIWVSPKLSIVALVLAIIIVLVIGGLSHMLKKTASDAQHRLGEINAITDEYLRAIKLIQSYNAQDFFKGKLENENLIHYNLSNRILRRRDLASPLSEILAVCIISILLWYGAHMVFNDEILPTTFFAFIFAFYNIIDPAKSFSREYYNVQKGLAALERINYFQSQVLNESDTEKRDIGKMDFSDSIVFSDVTFSHKNSARTLFSKLSLTIKRGEKIGIVGLSGSGKTSLIDLLLRFYKPQSGHIFLDNNDIFACDLGSYRSLFGLVTQDSELFHLPLHENISFSEDIKIDKIKRSLKVSNSDKIYVNNSDWLNTDLADQGLTLSGGEKQRLSIARAVYHDPEIVILDEPTSSLDGAAQIEVINALHELFINRTVIMISHNLELLKDMDQIVVLDSGSIAQKGSFDELSSNRGIFADLQNIMTNRKT